MCYPGYLAKLNRSGRRMRKLFWLTTRRKSGVFWHRLVRTMRIWSVVKWSFPFLVLVMQERSCELWNQKSVIEVAFSRCEAEVESGRLCSPSGFHPRIHHIDSPGRIPGAPDGAESPTRGHMYRPIHIHEVRGRYPFCFPFPFRDLIRISVTNCTAVRISSPMMKKCLDAIGHELTIVKMRSHGLYIPVMVGPRSWRIGRTIVVKSNGSKKRSPIGVGCGPHKTGPDHVRKPLSASLITDDGHNRHKKLWITKDGDVPLPLNHKNGTNYTKDNGLHVGRLPTKGPCLTRHDETDLQTFSHLHSFSSLFFVASRISQEFHLDSRSWERVRLWRDLPPISLKEAWESTFGLPSLWIHSCQTDFQ
jgi:hypothetical protein